MSLLTWQRTPCEGMVENAFHWKMGSEHLRASGHMLQTKQDRSHLKVMWRRKEEHGQRLDTDPKKASGASSLISATPDFSMLVCHGINWELDIYVPYKMRFPSIQLMKYQVGETEMSKGQPSRYCWGQGCMFPTELLGMWCFHPVCQLKRLT